MRTIFTLFATAAFCLHIMLGCCWHHGHGANAPPGHVHGAQAYDHVHVQALVPLKPVHRGCEHEHEPAESQHPEICTDPQCLYSYSAQVLVDDSPVVALLPVTANEILRNTAWQLPIGRWDDRGKFPPHVPRFLAIAYFLS